MSVVLEVVDLENHPDEEICAHVRLVKSLIDRTMEMVARESGGDWSVVIDVVGNLAQQYVWSLPESHREKASETIAAIMNQQPLCAECAVRQADGETKH